MQVLEKILEEIDEAIERYKKNANLEAVDICYGMKVAGGAGGRGSGGGGGGAARSTHATGAGGVGGDGWALVVEY